MSDPGGPDHLILDDWVTPREASDLIGVTPNQVRYLARQGHRSARQRGHAGDEFGRIDLLVAQEIDMRWAEIRQQYPNQWLVVDALEAHIERDRRRLDQMTVVKVYPDGAAAYRRYRELHQEHPQREFYFVHTTREELDIRERQWLGLRRNYERV